MAEQHRTTIKLADHLADSGAFHRLYGEGMGLVEEAAAYLDGDGRLSEQKLLPAARALYAEESMRLTTRLMHAASWLLLQRALNGREMSREQVLAEKRKLHLEDGDERASSPHRQELPPPLLSLMERSLRLQARVRRLDRELYPEAGDANESRPAENAVSTQLTLLKTAFGQL